MSARVSRSVILALLASASLAGEAPAEEPLTWRHAILEAKSDAGIIMMVSNGFAERQGLKLEILQFKNDVTGLQALLSGAIDSFDSGPNVSMLAAARGADVKFIGCPWPGMPYGIFVRHDITAVADLKGKTIAISAPGASPDVVAHALLAKYDIPATEVRFANLGGDLDRFKSVVAGVADAAVVTSEYVPIAEREGIKLLVRGSDILPNNMRFCMSSSAKVLAAKPESAVRFLAAEMTAWHYALGHRAEALALSREITGAKPDDPRPAYVFDDAVENRSADPDLSLPLDKLQWMQDKLLADGTLAHPFDLAKMIDAGPRSKALERLSR